MRIVKRPKKRDKESGDAEKGETPRELPPNDRLKRHADEAYGDTDIPAHKRADSVKTKNRLAPNGPENRRAKSTFTRRIRCSRYWMRLIRA
jgi:hypothetical protein